MSKGLKWVQSWRAEGQTGNGEQGQAMSPRRRSSETRRSSIFGYQVSVEEEMNMMAFLGGDRGWMSPGLVLVISFEVDGAWS